MASRTNERGTAAAGGVVPAAGAPVRTPSAPRERKPMLAALGVLLVLAGALAGTLVVLNSGNRVSVIQLKAKVAAGQPMPTASSAYEEARVAEDSGVSYISWQQLSALRKYRAAVDLVPGTPLIGRMLTSKSTDVRGKVVVGLSLKGGQFPSGVGQGDRVEIYDTSDSGSGSGSGGGGGVGGDPIASDAVVYGRPDSGGDGDLSGGGHALSVLVPRDEAGAVTKAASAGKASLVLLPPGSGTGSGS